MSEKQCYAPDEIHSSKKYVECTAFSDNFTVFFKNILGYEAELYAWKQFGRLWEALEGHGRCCRHWLMQVFCLQTMWICTHLRQ